jgi:acyl-CoA synthetase (AMP-forming)/AMP-acid ligase II
VQAVVVLHAGREATEADLIDFCRGRIAGYKRPQAVCFLSDTDMPRTATGKILHRVLREQISQPAVQAASAH